MDRPTSPPPNPKNRGAVGPRGAESPQNRGAVGPQGNSGQEDPPQIGGRSAPKKLAETDAAALWLLMSERPGENIQCFRQDDVNRARRRLEYLARSGRITNHGGTTRGQARWDLSQIRDAVDRTQ